MHSRLGPDATSMPRNDPMNRRQADARACELRLSVEPLEWSEELVGVRHIESGAVVAYGEDRLADSLLLTEYNARVGPLGRELPGIPEQVVEDDRDEVAVAPHDKPLGDLDGALARRLSPTQLRDDTCRQGREADGFPSQRSTVDARKVEEVIDQGRHALSASPHPLQVMAALVIELLPVLGEQRLAEA